MGKNYAEGYFQIGHMQLYVNRGIGTVGVPFRLNCPPEITIFTLQSA
jgi:predicted MPP superfamily phosphohydrolase